MLHHMAETAVLTYHHRLRHSLAIRHSCLTSAKRQEEWKW